MNLTDLIAAVVADCGRVTESTKIARVVKSVILAAHRSEYFPRDLTTDNTMTIASPGTSITLDLPDFFRKFAKVEIVDLSTGISLDKVLRPALPDDEYLEPGEKFPYRYYVRGDSVILNSVDSISRISWDFYQLPDLSSGEVETWIMANYEEVLISGALFYVYAKAGDSASAKIYENAWVQGLRDILAENLLFEL